jgi:hypothetical protein
MAEDKLNIDERLKIIRMQRTAYRRAGKAEKGRILDTLVSVTSLDRKTVTRHLNGTCERQPRRRQRGRTYGPEVDAALRVIHRAHNHICAERLTPKLVTYAQKLADHGHLVLTDRLLQDFATISVSTVGRFLARLHQDEPRQRRRARPPKGLLATIPMERISGFESEPGHFEVDLVHHSGPETVGEYVHTLNMVDVATGWSEMASVLGRSQRVMEDAFLRIALRLPFPILEVHTDNGSEFLNHYLLRMFGERFHGPHISRSRPWQKNDNPFVERANGAVVRAWLGHDRLDSARQAKALNCIHDHLWIYQNFFQPIMRLKSKEVDPVTHRARRRWDEARSPYDRLLASGIVEEDIAVRLTGVWDRSDPLLLREAILADVVALFELPGTQPGRTEDIFETLELPLSITI